MAWIPADNTLHGQPYEVNARVVLQKVLKEAASMGFGMNLGIECEVFVSNKLKMAVSRSPTADDNLEKSCYDFKRFMDRYGWLDKMATAIDDLGWELYSFDHEDANSQFEFDFKYADALTMCDRFVFFRYMAKHYASEEGLMATFMPKPLRIRPAAGAHFNMSLYDLETGANLFQMPQVR